MTRPENPLAELSEYLEFRRGADLKEDSYLYLNDKWYEILEIDGSWALGSPSGTPHYSDLKLEIKPERLYVTIPADAPVRFLHGQPCETLWPDQDLIYVDEAYVRADHCHGLDAAERVRGLFTRRQEPEEGRHFYAPLDPEEQGIPAGLVLDSDTALLVSWRPVRVSDVLRAVER